jgi:hypothetical protein
MLGPVGLEFASPTRPTANRYNRPTMIVVADQRLPDTTLTQPQTSA